jgi:hypothetical protein
MELPNNWNEVSVSQFKELYTLKVDEFDSIDDYNLYCMSILMDISVHDLEKQSYADYKKCIDKLTYFIKPPSIKPKDILILHDEKLYLYDLTLLTMGELIDLEYFIGNSVINNISNISSILYRRKFLSESVFIEDEFEKYGNWVFKRAKLFEDVSINDIYGVVQYYIQYRNNLLKTYEILFESNDPDDLELNEDDDYKTKAEKMQELQKEKIVRKWGWNALLFKLAKNDPTKLNEASEIPVIQALNTLMMIRQLKIEF